MVDDFSSQSDLKAMQTVAPASNTTTWVSKEEGLRGHVGSVNKLLNATKDFQYLVYLEDDWFFFKDEYFVSKALTILENDPTIAQVLFNVGFRELDLQRERELIATGKNMTTAGGVRYVLHLYSGVENTPESRLAKVLARGKLSNFHWPHFSLRPGVWRLSALREVGHIEDVPNFEFVHALKYYNHGYRTAFLPDLYAIHMAPLKVTIGYVGDKEINEMYVHHGLDDIKIESMQNAYSLAGTDR